jgi:Flp pilus assembly protein TadG
VLPFGLLIFVAGILIIINAWAVVDTKMTLDSAAQVMSRTISESDRLDTAAIDALARQTVADLGLDPGPISVGVDPADTALVRCQRVTVTLAYPVPALTLPILGRIGETIDVHATASELVDPYRSSEELIEGSCP